MYQNSFENTIMSYLSFVMDKLAEEIRNTFKLNNISTSSLEPDKLYLQWSNIRRKHPLPHARKVIFSKEIKKKISDNSELNELVAYFKEKFEIGEDITGHLSKTIYQAEYWDILLNHWNIYHLHLNKRKADTLSQMSNNRAEYLLFMIILDNVVFFLDVRKHPKGSGFTALSFLEIAQNNGWMQYCGFQKTDICNVTPKVSSDDQIYQLYKNKMNFYIELNGITYHAIGTSGYGNRFTDSMQLSAFKNNIIDVIQNDLSEQRMPVSVRIDLNNNFIVIQSDRTNSHKFTKIELTSYRFI